MPLPLTVSCFSKIQIDCTFLVPARLGCRGQRAIKRACASESVGLSNWKVRVRQYVSKMLGSRHVLRFALAIRQSFFYILRDVYLKNKR